MLNKKNLSLIGIGLIAGLVIGSIYNKTALGLTIGMIAGAALSVALGRSESQDIAWFDGFLVT